MTDLKHIVLPAKGVVVPLPQILEKKSVSDSSLTLH